MFRSRRRPIVYPQADHARFAAQLAAAWGNAAFPVPPLPHASFLRGVAEHDRGYGAFDADALGEIDDERWIAIQRRGFEPVDEDPIVDVVVALHVRRLVGDDPAGAELEARLPALLDRADLDPDVAAAADLVTDVCDSIAYDFCFEEPVATSDAGFTYRIDDGGGIWVDPWPFATREVRGEITAYEADGYPTRRAALTVPFVVRPLA